MRGLLGTWYGTRTPDAGKSRGGRNKSTRAESDGRCVCVCVCVLTGYEDAAHEHRTRGVINNTSSCTVDEWPMAYDAPCGGNGRYARPVVP
eukprot:4989011-Prymnesium_polylepis.1